MKLRNNIAKTLILAAQMDRILNQTTKDMLCALSNGRNPEEVCFIISKLSVQASRVAYESKIIIGTSQPQLMEYIIGQYKIRFQNAGEGLNFIAGWIGMDQSPLFHESFAEHGLSGKMEGATCHE